MNNLKQFMASCVDNSVAFEVVFEERGALVTIYWKCSESLGDIKLHGGIPISNGVKGDFEMYSETYRFLRNE